MSSPLALARHPRRQSTKRRDLGILALGVSLVTSVFDIGNVEVPMWALMVGGGVGATLIAQWAGTFAWLVDKVPVTVTITRRTARDDIDLSAEVCSRIAGDLRQLLRDVDAQPRRVRPGALQLDLLETYRAEHRGLALLAFDLAVTLGAVHPGMRRVVEDPSFDELRGLPELFRLISIHLND